MNQFIKLFTVLVFFASCQEQQKDFGQIKQGMNMEEVLSLAGEPTKKQNIDVAEFWVYNAANRTVVFRKDTVYNILTSTEARMDSLQTTARGVTKELGEDAKKAGGKIKEGAKKITGKADSLADEIRD